MVDLKIHTNAGEGRENGFHAAVMRILLTDRTTRRNIVWATDDYEDCGELYRAECPITMDLITGENAKLIQPRTTKTKSDRMSRTKGRAEVFTPAWMCNEQNNLIDAAWFGRPDVFNFSTNKGWKTNSAVISFEDKRGRRWKDYVDAKRLEITCGEAPYLTSRYDMVTGNPIEIRDRIGLLDRKLRVVSENAKDESEWLKWTFRAYESIYGFEYQGDSLLLARENLLYTFVEHMQNQWNRAPQPSELKRVASVISWNVWQMDGLSFAVPFGKTDVQGDGHATGSRDNIEKKEVYCKIRDWRSRKTLQYRTLVERK